MRKKTTDDLPGSFTMHQSYLCVLIVTMVTTASVAQCPRACECKWKNGKEAVICVSGNFSTVPAGLDSGTQVLDLTDNNIIVLKNKIFSSSGLVNLQKIYMIKCRLKNIEKLAFKNLINLIELDLSQNLLNSVPSSSFVSIPELRELHLNNNPFQAVLNEAFAAIPQLIRLEISGCRINNLQNRAFHGLEDSLKWLKLDYNKLSEVDANAFSLLHNLHGLELTNNPWNCSCKLRDLREWMMLQNVPYDIPPMCQHPKRLEGKLWKGLDLDEFACPPKIFASESKVKGVEGINVTLSCHIHGIPTPNVKWLLRNKVIANLSGQVVNNKKSYMVNINNQSSELIIPNAEIPDAGTYICAAENKAGKAEAVVTLIVAKKSNELKVTTKALIAGGLVGVSLTFVCCLLTAWLIRIRKKKWHDNACSRREDNYEKIELKPKLCQRNLNGGVTTEENRLAKKHGDYCVVPDTDHENDEEEESTLEITTHGGPNWTATTKSAPSSRDNINSSTCGTFNSIDNPSTFTTAPSWKGQSSLSTIYSSGMRQVPDVIGHSSMRAQSENGSAADFNELFCTLPRKHYSKHRSSESQTALLPESRYGSSESFARRLSAEIQRYPLNKPRASRESGSLLNLSREDRLANLTTPLLDVRGLESRLQQPQNPYDYHAAQLEKFLEEYRVLQKELTRMKETCDNICQEQNKNSSSGFSESFVPVEFASSSIQDSVDFKNFEKELTKHLMSNNISKKS